MTRHRTFDWRFFVALAFAMMVAYFVYVGYSGVKSSEAKDNRVDALLAEVHEQDVTAAHERERAADNQQALLDYTKALAARQRSLLTYLQRHGIEIPNRYLVAVPAPRIVDPSTGKPTRPHPQRHHAAPPPAPQHHQTPPETKKGNGHHTSPGPRPSGSRHGGKPHGSHGPRHPGHSGHAHGQGKHKGHGKHHGGKHHGKGAGRLLGRVTSALPPLPLED